MNLFIFSDIFLLCEPKKKGEMKLKDVIAYESCNLSYEPNFYNNTFEISSELSTLLFEVQVNITKYFVFKTTSTKEKQEITNLLSSTISQYNHRN